MFDISKDNKCPACGKGVYLYNVSGDFCCVDPECIYGHGYNNRLKLATKKYFEERIKRKRG